MVSGTTFLNNMGRLPRITVANVPYHVLNRGNNKQLVFRDGGDYLYYLTLIERYKEKISFKLYHFSLMPNHIHFLMEPIKDGDISEIMQRLTTAYTSYYNDKYGTVGHVWQGRFKSPLIDKDEYFLQCGLYIELNPRRAGLVEKPEDWRWSSYSFYAFGRSEPLIEKIIDLDPFYLDMAEDEEKRQELYRERVGGIMQDEFLKNIRRQFNKGLYGSQEFMGQMSKRLGIEFGKKKGRPRKMVPDTIFYESIHKSGFKSG